MKKENQISLHSPAENDAVAMPVNYNQLIDGIGSLIAQSKQHIATTINTTLVQTYWQIGRHIVEFEQNGNNRAAYGKSLIQQLSRDLTLRYGKGFGKSNLLYMRKLYITFQKKWDAVPPFDMEPLLRDSQI